MESPADSSSGGNDKTSSDDNEQSSSENSHEFSLLDRNKGTSSFPKDVHYNNPSYSSTDPDEIERVRRERNRMHAKKTRLRKKKVLADMQQVNTAPCSIALSMLHIYNIGVCCVGVGSREAAVRDSVAQDDAGGSWGAHAPLEGVGGVPEAGRHAEHPLAPARSGHGRLLVVAHPGRGQPPFVCDAAVKLLLVLVHVRTVVVEHLLLDVPQPGLSAVPALGRQAHDPAALVQLPLSAVLLGGLGGQRRRKHVCSALRRSLLLLLCSAA